MPYHLQRETVMRALAVTVFSLASLSAAPPQTFTGTIADSECDAGSHAHMRMGPTDAECTTACIDAHGASYVLYDGARAYALTDQRTPAPFAGLRVTVAGTLDSSGTTIEVESIVPVE